MCDAGRQLPHLHLKNREQFHYLNQGNNPEIDGVNDAKCFDETITALTMLGFTSRQQDDLLRILAAILHLGNVNIVNYEGNEGADNNDNEGSTISVSILNRFCRF